MKRTTTNSGAAGFTVIEILVATSIFAIIMIATLLMYDKSNRVFKAGVEAADVQQNTRIAFDKLVADIRMAGFDYDRDGVPSIEGAHQQPDEAIEHIGRTAVTVRANFDYNENPVNTDHGREFAVGGTPGASGLESIQFPVVTTGNHEIVTYALVSADASKNTGTITFYADVPDRKSHPDTGGRPENLVTITGVDLTNENPPYTLERIALKRFPAPITEFDRYPIAMNLRSMELRYFEDQIGTAPLTNLSGDPILPADYATTVGGLGQFNPLSTNVEIPRQLRAKIQSMKLILVGMTENPDPQYNDPNDAIAPRHRKYRLESLVVPRNYGRRGFKEQDLVEPEAPTITKVCVGYCGVAFVQWDQPIGGGAPEDYQIRADTDPNGSYPIRRQVGLKTFDFVPLDDPSAEYFFIVAAINSYGAAQSDRYPAGATGLSARNDTKPDVPGDLLATPLANAVRLDWRAPAWFESGAITCHPGGSAPPGLPIEEYLKGGFDIKRSRQVFVPATAGELVYNAQVDSATNPISIDPITLAASFTDNTRPGKAIMGPANCYTYYYALRTREGCYLPAQNTGNDPNKSQSAAWTDPALMEVTTLSNETPLAPASLEVEADSSCDIIEPGYCHVKLKWEKVTKDEMSQPEQYLTIGQYVLYRDTYRQDGTFLVRTPINVRFEEWDADPTITDFSDPAYVTYLDKTARSREDPYEPLQAGNDLVYHEYRVVAQQCTSPESESSPMVKYPCEFSPMLVDASMSGVIEGTGEFTSPWLIQPTSVLRLEFDVKVASMEASVLLPDLSRKVIGTVTDTTTGNFPWDASLPDGAAYRIDVLVETTDGCKKTLQYWLESTATNCCLTPVNLVTRLRQDDGPGQRMRIRLQNRCSDPLTINYVRLLWDPNKLFSGPGQNAIEAFVWPSTTTDPGTCPTVVQTLSGPANRNSPLQEIPPAGVKPVPSGSSNAGIACGQSGSDDYEIEIRFNRAYDPLNAPVSHVCVIYNSGGLTNQACQIAPEPSQSPGVCDPTP